MNLCRASGWGLLSGGLVLAVLSCDGQEDVSQITGVLRPAPGVEGRETGAAGGAGCVPGQVSTCVGVCGGFRVGYQVCSADGRSYDPCVCPELEPIASAGVDVATGARVLPPRFVPEPGAAPRSAAIGAACARDEDCGGGLNCFEAARDSLGLGGPAGGYCSIGCSSAADCTAVDRASTCSTLGGRSICVRTCRSQDAAPGEDKCLGRPDLTCLSTAAQGEEPPAAEPQFGVCMPRCQSDSGCSGRRCDLGTGLCTNTPRAGGPIGAACSQPESCAAGLCLGATEERPGFCSSFCTVGAPGCGYDGSEEVMGAACVLPQVPTEGSGDRGLCLELCDVAGDCTEPGFTCLPEATSGRAGVCLPAPVPTPGRGEGLSARCELDADCPDGLLCLAANADPFGLGGGPAEGYCSAPCEFAEDCAAGAVCATTPGGGYCLRQCDALSGEGCGGRSTLACVSIGGVAACVPTCFSDGECGERACDLELGLCVDVEAPSVTAEPGESEPGESEPGESEPPIECSGDEECPEGSSCDPLLAVCSVAAQGCVADEDCRDGVCNALDGTCAPPPIRPIGAACSQDPECTGAAPAEDDFRLCLPLGESAFCSALCVWGTPLGCEAYGTDAFCALPVQADIGACVELCNAPEDCEQPSYECTSIGTSVAGRTGACLPPPAGE